MAVSCDIDDLAEAAKCFNGYGPLLLKAIRIRLLCAFLNSESMDCDIDTLAEEARCYLANFSEGQMDAVETWLVCQVANSGGGGGGGSGQIKNYISDPNTELVVPDDLTKPAIAYPTVSGVGPTYYWDVGDQNWQ